METGISIFQRLEKKYRLTAVQREKLKDAIGGFLLPDIHGKSTVCSLYLDTPEHLLIRNSLDATVFKEKLRLRSYGVPENGSCVFLEIKRKYRGVVYKRRVAMTWAEACRYLRNGIKPFDSQILSEIDYAMIRYRRPTPAMLIAYEREAYTVEGQPDVRLTFDTAIRYRSEHLSPEAGTDGKKLLADGEVLLEIKTGGSMPLWLCASLDRCGIFPTSFSKYGNAYLESLSQNVRSKEGECNHACNF